MPSLVQLLVYTCLFLYTGSPKQSESCKVSIIIMPKQSIEDALKMQVTLILAEMKDVNLSENVQECTAVTLIENPALIVPKPLTTSKREYIRDWPVTPTTEQLKHSDQCLMFLDVCNTIKNCLQKEIDEEDVSLKSEWLIFWYKILHENKWKEILEEWKDNNKYDIQRRLNASPRHSWRRHHQHSWFSKSNKSK